MLLQEFGREYVAGILESDHLCIPGVFLFLDGRTEIFYGREHVGRSTEWVVVAAVPTLVVTYIVGILATTLSGVSALLDSTR